MSVSEIRSHFLEPASSFRPSCSTRFLSLLTAPRAIGMAIGTGAAALAGCAALPCLAAGGAVATIQTLFTKVVSGGKILRAAVFTEADHLSRLDIQGGLPFVTIPPILDVLETMRSPQAVVARNSLKGVLEYENCFDYLGINNHFLLNDLIKKIRQLKPGQILAIPLSNMDIKGSGHIILGSIECDENGKFILRIHNGGDGLNFHYTRYEEESGRQLYQTTLEIADITMPALVKFIKSAASIQAFRYGNNSEKLYKLIPNLKGRILPPRVDSRYWMGEQMGNSCSGYSIKCFLNFILSPADFKHFRVRFLASSIEGLKRGLQRGWFYERTKEHQIAYKELCVKAIQYGRGDLTETVVVRSSQLTTVASRVQRKFWGFFFPLTYSSMSSLKLGLDSYDFSRLGRTEYFKELADAFETAVHMNHLKDSKLPQAIEEYRKLFTSYYHKIDQTKYSAKEIISLRKIYFGVMKESRVVLNDAYLLHKFYSIVFEKQRKVLTDQCARRLMDAVGRLKKKDFIQARISIEATYKMAGSSLKECTRKQAEEYEFIICQMLYLEDAWTLEEMELRAGIAMFFLKVMNFSWLHGLPMYLEKNMDFYRDLRLDKAFPKSSWSSMILTYSLSKIKKQNPPKSFEPTMGPALSTII